MTLTHGGKNKRMGQFCQRTAVFTHAPHMTMCLVSAGSSTLYHCTAVTFAPFSCLNGLGTVLCNGFSNVFKVCIEA